MGLRVVLGKIICQVSCSLFPVDYEVSLTDAVMNPIKYHSGGLGVSLFHVSIDSSMCAAVVNLERNGWLGMDHLGKNVTDNGLLFGIKKCSIKFSFGGRRWYHRHDGSDYVNGVIH